MTTIQFWLFLNIKSRNLYHNIVKRQPCPHCYKVKRWPWVVFSGVLTGATDGLVVLVDGLTVVTVVVTIGVHAGALGTWRRT